MPDFRVLPTGSAGTETGELRYVMRSLLIVAALSGLCSGCAVVTVADAAVSVAATAVKVTATVVETTVDVAAAGVKAATGSSEEKE